MADSDSFKCPNCKKEYTIAELELWEVYEEDDKQTEINCPGCNAEIILTSQVTGWHFDAELRDFDDDCPF